MQGRITSEGKGRGQPARCGAPAGMVRRTCGGQETCRWGNVRATHARVDGMPCYGKDWVRQVFGGGPQQRRAPVAREVARAAAHVHVLLLLRYCRPLTLLRASQPPPPVPLLLPACARAQVCGPRRRAAPRLPASRRLPALPPGGAGLAAPSAAGATGSTAAAARGLSAPAFAQTVAALVVSACKGGWGRCCTEGRSTQAPRAWFYEWDVPWA